jgi:aspartyl-tRNA synthetase
MTTTSATEEELTAQINALGEQIKQAKGEGKPQEEWNGILQEMLQLKTAFKTAFGKDFGPPPKAKKQESADDDDEGTDTANLEASEKNKEKREKKRLEKLAKDEKKKKHREEQERLAKEKADRLAGVGQTNFGDKPLVQSTETTDQVWTEIAALAPSMQGQTVLIRGYLQKSSMKGKIAFCLIRSGLFSVQGVAAEGKDISPAMTKYMAALPLESVVDVRGVVSLATEPIRSSTQSNVELQITELHAITKAGPLPFVMEDACRPDLPDKETVVGAYDETKEEVGQARVGQSVRLDNRWLDLRTPANQAIFRIESMVGLLFREFLTQHNFIEIHTPKLIGGASEGGSDVFTLDYFGQPACLAMSPQLHKQMTAACSGFERVFEVGPVFRAENSNTHRHLCEFTGLDLEMAIHEHYDEVLHLMSEMFVYIFDGIKSRCAVELERVREQHPFEDLQYLRPTLKLTYPEGCAMLREAGVKQGDDEDLSTENEKKLGELVKAKYQTDFFFMDKYPLDVRPFYTMPCPHNPKASNSYDFFIRGQEIVSGAQRIHEPTLLEERATAKGIPLDQIASYVNSFRHGALPHGGGGVGLERVVMLYLGLPNIRKTAWFPRDPKRLSP